MSQDRVIELNGLLVHYRHHYYILDAPLITDQEYDTLERELKGLITQDPSLAHLAPVLTVVGSDLVGQGGGIKHDRPMLSLENQYTIDSLKEWVQGVVTQIPDVWFSLEPKVDGGSMSLTYLHRKLIKGVARGDGQYGDDLTAVVAASGAVPVELPPHAPEGLLEVRGEIWMPMGQMARLNAEQEKLGKKGWTSPRNLATGTLKLKDLQEVKRRGLRFRPWDCFGIPDDYLAKYHRDPRWKSHALDYLYRIGFAQPFIRSTPGEDLVKSLNRHITELQVEREHLWHGEGLGMLTDGIVLKVESQAHRDLLGARQNVPLWSVSYKFQDAKGVTTLEAIEWSVSRNGKLTPVGVLNPLVLAGASISRVNLNNLTWMAEIGIEEVPCQVEICRSGDVIPVVTKVIK